MDLHAIRAAAPRPWTEPALLLDHFVLDGQAFAAWCGEHFGIRTRCDAQLFILELCPLSERVVIDAHLTGDPVAYRIPGCCYQRITEEL
jgi:hypothetical protein